MSQRIYILGAGNLGKFVAHAIAGIPKRPPLTLLFRSHAMLKAWEESDRSIEVVTDGMGEKRGDFKVEVLTSPERDLSSIPVSGLADEFAMPRSASLNENHQIDSLAVPGIIYQVILSVKAPMTVQALSGIADRLTHDSTILFLQNGVGMVDEVNEKLFPNEATRPNYIVGVITHGVNSTPAKAFSVVHAGSGTMALGILPRRSMLQPRTFADAITYVAPSARYLLRTLTRTAELAAVGFAPTDILQLQTEKLAVNAVINPLTVMFDCKNGELLCSLDITRVIRLLLAEISLVLRSLPELQGVPNVTMRFSPERLESMVSTISDTTAGNISSMLQDVRAARVTEIDYLNGYIVRRGEEMGIKCVMNYMLMQMVKSKGWIARKRLEEYVPMQRK